jgi:outer membrane protein assembly factor BamB
MRTGILLVIASCLLSSVAWATEHLVPQNYASIQAAIDAAQNGDTVIVAPGTYRENISFKGKAITVRSALPGNWDTIRNTIVDGGAAVPKRGGYTYGSCVAFDHGEGQDSRLDGLTLTHGTGQPANDPSLTGRAGGGIYCRDSSPALQRCNIVDNMSSPSLGGGIALIGSCSATVENCVITGNSASAKGGGVFISGLGTPSSSRNRIVHCTIAQNYNATDSSEVWLENTESIVSNSIVYPLNLVIDDLACVTFTCAGSVYLNESGSLQPVASAEFEAAGGNISRSPDFVLNYSDLHLRPGSPCINAGDPNFAGGALTDVDGQLRVMGGRTDIGADEVVPVITVYRPAAADVWSAGTVHTIEWSPFVTGAVDVLFSQDNGATWQTIAEAIVGASSFTWQVPNTVTSDQCLVSVAPSNADPTIQVVPSGRFAIQRGGTAPEVEAGWSTLGGDSSRAGMSRDQGPLQGEVKWKFETGAGVVSSVTTGPDGRIHVACENGRLYTLNTDGNLLWSVDVNAPLASAPTTGPDGSLFVGSRDGKLYAIDPNGKRRWTHATGGAIYSSPAVASNGNIYVGSADGNLYALRDDGSDLWQFKTAGTGLIAARAICVSPSLAPDGTVYVAGLYDPNLYALNPTDGSVKWACSFKACGGWPFASPVVGRDGTLYQTLLYDSHLYAIEPQRGTILWAVDLFDTPSIPTRDTYADGWSEPVLGPDGTIYVSLDDVFLRAVDPAGHIKWATALGDLGGFTLTVDRSGMIYAAADDGSIYVVYSSGTEVHRFMTGGWPAYPVIVGDDTLVVTDSRDYSMLTTDAKNAVWAISSRMP